MICLWSPLNVKGLHALDLRTAKPNGEAWDFRRTCDRKLAREMVALNEPTWVIGAPPCTAFSIWNWAMNYQKMDGYVVRRKLEEGRLHVNCVCSLYRMQQKGGRYYLHEHPATALSWEEDAIRKLAALPGTYCVTADQCAYGLVTPSADDPDKNAPSFKPNEVSH